MFLTALISLLFVAYTVRYFHSQYLYVNMLVTQVVDATEYNNLYHFGKERCRLKINIVLEDMMHELILHSEIKGPIIREFELFSDLNLRDPISIGYLRKRLSENNFHLIDLTGEKNDDKFKGENRRVARVPSHHTRIKD